MIPALLRRQVQHHLKLLMAVGGGLAAIFSFLIWISSQIEFNSAFITVIETLLPPALSEMMLSQFSVISFGAFLGFGFQHPVVLVSSIAFMVIAGSIPAAERENGLLDLIMARPLSRGQYIASIIIMVAASAGILAAVLLATVFVGLQIIKHPEELPWTDYIQPSIAFALLMAAIGGYTLLLSSAAQRRGQAVARAVGLTLALFFVEVIADQWEPMARLRWISPFHYFDPIQAAAGSGLEVFQVMVLLVIFVASSFSAIWIFRRRDL